MATAHAHTALSHSSFPQNVTAATLSDYFRTVPAHYEVKGVEAVSLCDVDIFSSPGLSNLEPHTMRLHASGIQAGVCQFSIWPLTGRSQTEAFHRPRSHPSPAYFVSPGCVCLGLFYACAAGGPSGGTARVFRVPPLPPLLCCSCPSGASLPALATRGEERGRTERACAGLPAVPAVPLAGWTTGSAAVGGGPGRRHVGGRSMPGRGRRGLRGSLLRRGGLPWRSIYVPVAGGAGEGVRQGLRGCGSASGRD